MISNGGKVIFCCLSISSPRSLSQAGSTGRLAEQWTTHVSQVVQARKVSTMRWSHSARPSMCSRSQNHLPRGLWLSQPRP